MLFLVWLAGLCLWLVVSAVGWLSVRSGQPTVTQCKEVSWRLHFPSALYRKLKSDVKNVTMMLHSGGLTSHINQKQVSGEQHLKPVCEWVMMNHVTQTSLQRWGGCNHGSHRSWNIMEVFLKIFLGLFAFLFVNNWRSLQSRYAVGCTCYLWQSAVDN